MYISCLATDYDGTLAHDGIVDDATADALVAFRRSGRRLLLVTGRLTEWHSFKQHSGSLTPGQ